MKRAPTPKPKYTLTPKAKRRMDLKYKTSGYILLKFLDKLYKENEGNNI